MPPTIIVTVGSAALEPPDALAPALVGGVPPRLPAAFAPAGRAPTAAAATAASVTRVSFPGMGILRFVKREGFVGQGAVERVRRPGPRPWIAAARPAGGPQAGR